MLRNLLDATADLRLPILAMLIFLAMFLAVLVRVLQRARAAGYQHMASLPLDDDTHGNELP